MMIKEFVKNIENQSKFIENKTIDKKVNEILDSAKSGLFKGEFEKVKNNKEANSDKTLGNLKEKKLNVRDCGYNNEIGKKNKIDGIRRENNVVNDLKKMYTESDGFKILRERELLDKDGKPVKDHNGEKRRIDIVVIDTKNNKIADMIEVTSKTSDKSKQIEKENEIKGNGGNYIKDNNTGKLYKIPEKMNTRIERRD